jgi:beta-lactamase regulating signal transducer with metallopeptidase domain
MTWWISKQIRTERELCCDRVAVRVCERPRDYAQALLKLARMHVRPRQLGLAATGGPLLHRVQLLFGMPAEHLKPPHWSSLVTLLIGMVSISLRPPEVGESD